MTDGPKFLRLPAALEPLASFRNWVVWRRETIKGKVKKPPYNPRTGSAARTDDKSTWATYEEACAAYQAGGFDGVGFMLKGTRFGALDPDNCVSRDAAGRIVVVEGVRKLVEAARCYVEISPSGKGLRLLGYVHSERAVNSSRSQGDYKLEMYRRTNAYVTITGDELEGFVGQPLVNIDAVIDRLNVGATAKKAQADNDEDGVDKIYDYPNCAFANVDDAERAIIGSGKIKIRGDHNHADMPVISVEAVETIHKNVPLGYDRSAAFQSIVSGLYRKGFAPDDVLRVFEKYPNGIAEKFESEGRLSDEVKRSWKAAAEYEDARVEKLKGWLESASDKTLSPAGDKVSEGDDAPKDEVIQAPTDSEEVLALAFIMQHRSHLRYVAEWKKWFIFKDGCWREDKTLRVCEAARDICRRAGNACNDYKEAKKIASAKTMDGLLRLARTDRRLMATADQWDSNAWLLNTPDGVVDLRTGEMRPARAEDYCTKMTSVAPSDGGCPLWLSVLNTAFKGNQDMIAYMQRLYGYCLTGITNEHALFFLFGDGRNGKGVQISTISRIMSDYAATAAIETFTASKFDRHPTELAALVGARLVTVAETEKGRRWAESRIKMLTGGDRVKAHFMHKDDFEYDPQFKLVFHGNHKPNLSSINEAIKARFQLVPFHVIIPEEERDHDLAEKLRSEHSAILKWLIEGCLEWQRIGLSPPAAAREATESYLAEEDSIANWIDACCERVAKHWESVTKLFESWAEWAGAAKEDPGTNKTFSEALAQHGFSRIRKTERGFEGLRLRKPEERFKLDGSN